MAEASSYIDKINSLDWSDDDDDERYRSNSSYISKNDHDSHTKAQSRTSPTQQPYYADMIVDMKYKYDRKPSKYFNGALKPSYAVSARRRDKSTSTEPLVSNIGLNKQKSDIPLTIQKLSVQSKISLNVLEVMWDEWVECGSDGQGLLELSQLNQVINNLMKKGFEQKLFDQISFPHYDLDDFISFGEFIGELVRNIEPGEAQPMVIYPLPPCCGRRACRCSIESISTSYLKAQDEVQMQVHSQYLLYSLYNQYILSYDGRIKINDMVDIMKKENIKYDKSQIPSSYWQLYGDFLICNFQEFEEIYNCLLVESDLAMESGNTEKTYKVNIFTVYLRVDYSDCRCLASIMA